jgi:hypothetical protein
MKSISVYVSLTASLVSGALLTSCGADTAPSTDPAYYTPGGYWTGSVNGQTGVGLVDESGDFTFIPVDGQQYPGTLAITNPNFPGDQPSMPYSGSLTGSMQGFTPGGFPNYGVSDGNGTGVLSGIIVPRQTINADVFYTDNLTETISLTFNALYYVPSSLATISGTYKDLATGTTFTINADGAVFAQDATTGCVINGAVSIINPSYNVYGIEVSYASCTGSLAPMNGVTLGGMAALDNTKSPEQVLAGVWSSVQLSSLGSPPCPAPQLNPPVACFASITYRLVRL